MRVLNKLAALFAAIGLVGCVPMPEYKTQAPAPIYTQTEQTTSATLGAQLESVALILPLSGPQASAGKAVRDGFLAAVYEAKARGESVPEVRVIDAQSEGNVVANYNEAVAGGAKFVVGPLTKPGVERLANGASLSVPVLALNETNQRIPSDMVQFGLTPENDAREVANKALQKGMTRALVLAPQGQWGQRMKTAFYQAFQTGGGRIIDSATYDSPKTLASVVRRLLKVSDEEEKVVGGKKEKVKPEPRTDADMIFLIGNVAQARQIKPILTFYYAPMAIFVPPSAVNGREDRLADRDLNGAYTVDSPWIFNRAHDWQNVKNRLSAEDGFTENARLYGMGIDAFQLMRAIPSLNEGATFNGVSGNLTVQNGRVQRDLYLGQFSNGSVTVLQ